MSEIKKIIVVTSDVPFVYGGHIIIAEELVKQLNKYGYNAILWRTPQNKFGKQLSAYLATYLTDLTETGYGEKIDAVISLRFPAYAVKHKNHICWLNHRMREYYDLWNMFRSKLSLANAVKESVRRFIMHRIDKYLLTHNVKRLYAQSKNIQQRLYKWGKINSEVIYPPAIERYYRCDKYGDYILCPARLHKLKRIDLAIKALKHVRNKKLFLIVVGEGPEKNALNELTKSLNLVDKVKFLDRVTDSELIDLYANCLAVFYGPFNEDYGLVILEAFSSKKAVITCIDSGGAIELIEHNKNGLIVEPDEVKIAESIDFISDKSKAELFGDNGYICSKEFSWEKVIMKLLYAL